MNIDEIKSRLMKMKALANAGSGGERTNAQKLLMKLAGKYSINLNELDTEEIKKYSLKLTETWRKKLFSQLLALMRQEKLKRGEVLCDKELRTYLYTRKGPKNERFTYATECDWLEFTAKFEVLSADYKQQEKNFYLAFLMANNLLTDPDDNTHVPTEKEKAEHRAAFFMSVGIKPSRLHKRLEVRGEK